MIWYRKSCGGTAQCAVWIESDLWSTLALRGFRVTLVQRYCCMDLERPRPKLGLCTINISYCCITSLASVAVVGIALHVGGTVFKFSTNLNFFLV